MHARLGGKILCSGPSHVAVDNFAARLYECSASIARTYNGGMELDNLAARRNLFVVRGYKPSDEMEAVKLLLEHPDEDPTAGRNWHGTNNWRLPLSVAFWALCATPASGKCTKRSAGRISYIGASG